MEEKVICNPPDRYRHDVVAPSDDQLPRRGRTFFLHGTLHQEKVRLDIETFSMLTSVSKSNRQLPLQIQIFKFYKLRITFFADFRCT